MELKHEIQSSASDRICIKVVLKHEIQSSASDITGGGGVWGGRMMSEIGQGADPTEPRKGWGGKGGIQVNIRI